MEIDGDRIRAQVAMVADGSAEAERDLLALAGRSEDARAAVFREADRALRTARLRAEIARDEELSAAGDQSKLAAALVRRTDAEREVARLTPLLDRLRR